MSWILFSTLFWLVTLSSGACPDNLDSPLVFDAIFYLNNHPDLEAAGYNTPGDNPLKIKAQHYSFYCC